MATVSCIIPAHNEAERITSVLEEIYNHPLLSEIIVVQNFSTDNTSEVVKRFIKQKKASKMKLINVRSFPGKAYAMYKGAEKSKSEILLFIDADLVGVKKKNITDIIQPIIKGEAHMSLGFRGDALFLFRVFRIDPVGGERAISRDLFFKMPDCRKTKFAVESLMNDFLVNGKKTIAIIDMPNVKNTMKYKKRGIIRGIYDDFLMLKNIFSKVSLFRFMRNYIYFVRNSKRS